MLAVNGKNKKMLVCQDRACGHRETISRITNARCPNCHRKMELYVKGKEDTLSARPVDIKKNFPVSSKDGQKKAPESVKKTFSDILISRKKKPISR